MTVTNEYLKVDDKNREPYLELNNIKSTLGDNFVYPNTSISGVNVQWPHQPQLNYIVAPASNGTMTLVPAETAHIHEYTCWSLANICFGGIFLGFISLLLSHSVGNRKMQGRLEDARRMSRITLLWNTFVTTFGIAVTVFVVLRYKP